MREYKVEIFSEFGSHFKKKYKATSYRRALDLYLENCDITSPYQNFNESWALVSYKVGDVNYCEKFDLSKEKVSNENY